MAKQSIDGVLGKLVKPSEDDTMENLENNQNQNQPENDISDEDKAILGYFDELPDENIQEDADNDDSQNIQQVDEIQPEEEIIDEEQEDKSGSSMQDQLAEDEPKKHKLIFGKFATMEAAEKAHKDFESKFHEQQTKISQLEQQLVNQQALLSNFLQGTDQQKQQSGKQQSDEFTIPELHDIDDETELTGKDVKKILTSYSSALKDNFKKDVRKEMIDMLIAFDQNSKVESQFRTETEKFKDKIYNSLGLEKGNPDHDQYVNRKINEYAEFRKNPNVEESDLITLYMLKDTDLNKVIFNKSNGSKQIKQNVMDRIKSNARKSEMKSASSSPGTTDDTVGLSPSEKEFQEYFGIPSGYGS